MFKNMKIGVRFGLGLGLVAILLIVITALSITQLSRQNEKLNFIVNDRYSKMAMVMEIENEINMIAIALRNMMLTDSREDMLKQEGKILEARKKIEGNIEKLQKKTIVLPKGKELLQHVLDNRIKYIEGSKHLIALIEEGKKDESRTYLTHVLRPILGDYQASLTTFGKFYVELMHVTVQEAVDNYNSARNMILELTLIAIVLALAAGIVFWVTRSTTKPLNLGQNVSNRLNEGDLDARVVVASKDEIGQLLAAMQNMVGKLSQVATEVRSASDNLSSASEEVSAIYQYISQATSEQATMETTEGGESLRHTVFAMKQIAKKIGIINDIAYQTNLLARNAAIEAARVGEHGKGFAAAAEVHKLSERSQAAAQAISELAYSSEQMAEKGGKLLNEMVPSNNKTLI
ncbi:MAG: methyl-accepting chemotaxis protein [Candidatus Nitrotoga sp.]|nr:methyl-accepting chemotaxis protein [Candidatus Nitrotoga sp.]MDO9446971.1 methyl-accepting chemotaxis protein [Candidatus Nitrotoga sp.]MDP1637623.1 methyl-accepting chemotaxis protein [Candidatus Nitrotoga sp.]MDP1856901.1 methyl-accepting chemotaxis protein [Candidatus Nitrotoga sp.]MDP3496691.1 methyl-accepting chemotaxis protein [Candidatus Nitrotoga sp.]